MGEFGWLVGAEKQVYWTVILVVCRAFGGLLMWKSYDIFIFKGNFVARIR
jgi:hypothetical protein